MPTSWPRGAGVLEHPPAAPRRGLAVVFVFGLVLDVHQASLLGQYALAYAVLIYFASWCNGASCGSRYRGQALQLDAVVRDRARITVVLRLIGGGHIFRLAGGAGAGAGGADVAIVGWLLLAPQRRAQPDANRPL